MQVLDYTPVRPMGTDTQKRGGDYFRDEWVTHTRTGARRCVVANPARGQLRMGKIMFCKVRLLSIPSIIHTQ